MVFLSEKQKDQFSFFGLPPPLPFRLHASVFAKEQIFPPFVPKSAAASFIRFFSASIANAISSPVIFQKKIFGTISKGFAFGNKKKA